MLIGIAILTSDAGATIGRDTLLGANMIMINLAGGLALFLGGLRHREQTYNFQGTSAYLAVVITLCVLGFILPNYTKATPQGSVTNVQAAGIMIVTLGIYVTFLLASDRAAPALLRRTGPVGQRENGAGRRGEAGRRPIGRREPDEGRRSGSSRCLLLAGVVPGSCSGEIPHHDARPRQQQARDAPRAGRGDHRPDRRLAQDDLGHQGGAGQSNRSVRSTSLWGHAPRPWASSSRSSSPSGS